MADWFDALAKDSAQQLSRRQVFARLIGGFAAAALGVVGLQAGTADNCGKLCEQCCRNAFPRGGPELGECIRQCHEGQGICGPIVCPQE